MSDSVTVEGFSVARPLSARQRAAVTKLLAGGKVSQIAVELGCSERSLWRWLRRQDFRQALNEAQGGALEVAAASLLGLALQGIDVLEQVLDDTKASPASKLRAVALILEHGRAWHEAAALEARVSALERKIGNDSQE